jgi:hypothetical protein
MSFAEIMVRELEKVWDKDALHAQETRQPTNKERIVATFVQRAAAGDLQAFIELMNRTEGKVPDQLMANVEHAVKVVPWDDEDDPAFVYVPDQNATDRGTTQRMVGDRPGDVPALPDMYPPAAEQVQGLDQITRDAEEAEFVKADDASNGTP